jgi:hypothetical protein
LSLTEGEADPRLSAFIFPTHPKINSGGSQCRAKENIMPMVTCKNPRCNKGHNGKPKQFNVRQADLNRGWGKYCGKSCKAQHQEQNTGQYANLLRGGFSAIDNDPSWDAHKSSS